ncbi:MAG TPA: hypothetical protein VHB21_07010, partial [Minicystis sp.]|nr:hypothetical protein [Minicystis sp.]
MRHIVLVGLGIVSAVALGCTTSSGTGAGGGNSGSGGSTASGNPTTTTGPGSGTQCAIVRGGVTLSAGTATDPSIAWNGKAFGVAYQDVSSDMGDILFTLVDKDGNATGSTVIEQDANASILPSVVAQPGGG